VSRHLAYLRRAGLVSARRDGVWIHYRVSPSLDPEIRQVLDAAVRASKSVTTTAKDRARFEKAFGPLYVVPTGTGGACCSPRG
jgi:ArsR family transcriptional regulator